MNPTQVGEVMVACKKPLFVPALLRRWVWVEGKVIWRQHDVQLSKLWCINVHAVTGSVCFVLWCWIARCLGPKVDSSW